MNDDYIGYFGTTLTEHGHYFFNINKDRFVSRGDLNFKDFPFNPERLIESWVKSNRASPIKGQRFYFQIEGWSILYFEGSPIDRRGGTKSVFFVKRNLNENQMLSLVHSSPLAKKIIESIK